MQPAIGRLIVDVIVVLVVNMDPIVDGDGDGDAQGDPSPPSPLAKLSYFNNVTTLGVAVAVNDRVYVYDQDYVGLELRPLRDL